MNDLEYTKNSFQYRGYIIDTFNTLEKRIEFIISDHFIGSLDNSFISTILDRLNFEAKRASTKVIFDQLEERTGAFKTAGNAKPHKKVSEDLERRYVTYKKSLK